MTQAKPIQSYNSGLGFDVARIWRAGIERLLAGRVPALWSFRSNIRVWSTRDRELSTSSHKPQVKPTRMAPNTDQWCSGEGRTRNGGASTGACRVAPRGARNLPTGATALCRSWAPSSEKYWVDSFYELSPDNRVEQVGMCTRSTNLSTILGTGLGIQLYVRSTATACHLNLCHREARRRTEPPCSAFDVSPRQQAEAPAR